MRIIIDVNLWVSFGMGKSLDRLRLVLPHPEVELFASDDINREIVDVVKRPRLKKYLKPDRVKEIFELLSQFAYYVRPIGEGNADFKDAKDNYLLNLAAEVNADFLVTGDKPMLKLGQYQQTRIISFADLLVLLEIE
ncbi:MAG: putative toxin-antitoxin system toxin component, PIN family [Saprospiraceae bacterium]